VEEEKEIASGPSQPYAQALIINFGNAIVDGVLRAGWRWLNLLQFPSE